MLTNVREDRCAGPARILRRFGMLRQPHMREVLQQCPLLGRRRFWNLGVVLGGAIDEFIAGTFAVPETCHERTDHRIPLAHLYLLRRRQPMALVRPPDIAPDSLRGFRDRSVVYGR